MKDQAGKESQMLILVGSESHQENLDFIVNKSFGGK